MKYLSFVLTIIAIFLVLISVEINHMGESLNTFNEHMPMIMSSNQGLIIAGQRLELEIVALRKQLEELSAKITVRSPGK
ncbi:MAG: hypothetical protein ABIG46_07670 [Candidatus Omnitrophota bacterium]